MHYNKHGEHGTLRISRSDCIAEFRPNQCAIDVNLQLNLDLRFVGNPHRGHEEKHKELQVYQDFPEISMAELAEV